MERFSEQIKLSYSLEHNPSSTHSHINMGKLMGPIPTPEDYTSRTFNLQTSIDQTNLCFLPTDGINSLRF